MFDFGGFGENFSSIGMLESKICLGDLIQIGSAILEVSQGRQPCWKLNERFKHPEISVLVQKTRLTGWYYRVQKEGEVKIGDKFILLNQPYPKWTLDRVSKVMFANQVDYAVIEGLMQLPLPFSWKNILENRLRTGVVENWDKRLQRGG